MNSILSLTFLHSILRENETQENQVAFWTKFLKGILGVASIKGKISLPDLETLQLELFSLALFLKSFVLRILLQFNKDHAF